MTKKLERPILKELDLPQYKRPDLKDACDFLDMQGHNFTLVKTKYNKKGQWDAISLRGYSDSPSDILKPDVLKSGIELAELRDTHLTQVSNLVSLIEILAHIPAKFERVRVMRIRAGTSISKHTDKVDKDIKAGKIVRIHIPIRTNHNVHFYLWKDKKPQHYNLEQGKYYYTDVTKPHAVHNKATFDRLHLVADCYSNDKIEALILQNEKFEEEEQILTEGLKDGEVKE
tara:strand:+ start:855 stop:1541 length:687 start_codon:yes stop_codon:yes gene_type:complete